MPKNRRAENAREAAFMALHAWRRQSSWPELAFKTSLAHLPPRERALATQLGFGVLARMLTLDEYIRHASSVGLSRVEPIVLDILRLGVYQLLFLTKIPKSAAVDQTVELAHKYARPRAVPYVNAVMRTVSGWENPPEISQLWQRTSHPQWLAERIARQEGSKRATAFLEFNNTIPPICLNLKPGSQLLPKLLDSGIDVKPHAYLSDCLTVSKPGDVEQLPGFREGDFLIADTAARLAVMAADPQKGETVLDACAAPGGKSVLMHWHSGGGLDMTSCDLYGGRVRILQETLAKYGVDGVNCIERSAASFYPDFSEKFDLVLADVPCSGFGVIRKKPEIRYKKPDDVDALPSIQAAILDNLANYVKPGGRMVYVTCTVLDSENGSVVDGFLDKHDGFIKEPFSLPVGDAPDGDFHLWPPEHNMDGFYIACLRKRGAL